MWRTQGLRTNQNLQKTTQKRPVSIPRLLIPLSPAIISCVLLLPDHQTAPLWLLPLLWLIPLLLWSGVALLFPMRAFLIVAAMGIGAYETLTMANLYKINLNGMPITALDIHITISDPNVLWQSLGISIWFGWMIATTALIVLAVIFVILARSLTPITISSVASMIATLLLTGVVGNFFSERIYIYVKNLLAANQIAISNGERLSSLSTEMGAIPFLIYSWKLENETGSEFFKKSADVKELPASTLEESYKKHFANPGFMTPNIVMIHLESIFNPNTIFELDRHVSSPLFEENQHTHLLRPMRVNIVGGGSWVSEFEAITGLDSRLFGYSGYYTHVSISPYIAGALPDFLKRKGYATSAFVATNGVFYNSRNAYGRYGFEEFYDWKDLQLSQDWAAPDSEMASAFVKKSHAFEPGKPFFSFLVTLGAHSPYLCKNFESPSSFMAKFKTSDDWDMNCELNEYLLLLKDSEKAVTAVHERLKAIEQDTGRPFVLMIYGDHQPYSFTMTWRPSGSKSYDGVRTAAPRNQTFLHLMSSTRMQIMGFDGATPITLLPTLLSSFTAKRADEVYMLSNTFLFEKCGPDVFQGLGVAGLFGGETGTGITPSGRFITDLKGNSAPSPSCQAAQRQAIANQRNSGIVSNNMR